MGLFSNRSTNAETSHSRQWIAQHGPVARKNMLAFAITNRLCDAEGSSAASWGMAIDGEALTEGRRVVENVVVQDRSLTRCVARDVALLFESFGGLAVNQRAASDAAGHDTQAGADSVAVARVIRDRNEDRIERPADAAVYLALFEDPSPQWQQRAVDIAVWSATVLGRMRNAGQLDIETPLFKPRAAYVPPMDEKGWYPNPVNPGDTSTGDATIQRWWDGNDWTDQLRLRDGRRWTPHRQSLLTAPNN